VPPARAVERPQATARCAQGRSADQQARPPRLDCRRSGAHLDLPVSFHPAVRPLPAENESRPPPPSASHCPGPWIERRSGLRGGSPQRRCAGWHGVWRESRE